MDSDDPSGLLIQPPASPRTLPSPEGPGVGEGKPRTGVLAGAGGMGGGPSGRARQLPRCSPQRGPGPSPTGQSTSARAPRGSPRGARRSPSRPRQPQARSVRAGRPARPPGRASSPARGLTACPAARPRRPRVAVPGRRPPACPRR